MSGLSSILMTGLSGLQASQAAMRVASQNISNANTPGYVRAEVTLSPASYQGNGGGVQVTSIQRAADRFLATASYIAQAAQGGSAARSDILSRAQAEFGDPTSNTSMFASLNDFWSGVTQIGIDPSSSLQRDDTVNSLQTTFDEVSRVGDSIQSLISEADQRIGDDVASAQNLMNRIASLNDEIRASKRSGADSTAAENAQSAVIDDLSKLIDVRVEPLSDGGVNIRTSGGALLVGAQASTISYTPNSSAFGTHGVITLNPQLGTQSNLEPYLLGGEIKGLLQARDQDLPRLADALGGFAGALADTLNKVHNENSASPAVNSFTGRQTGLLATDSLNFTGKSIVGVTDANGNLTQRLTIDFGSGSGSGAVTAEPPGAGPFTFTNSIGSFTTALNSALAGGTPPGAASFSKGVLSMNAGTGGGLVIQQDPTTPSARASRGFSQFFGLNDLVSRPTPIFFENGIKGTDVHGFNAGGSLTYQVTDSSGRYIATRTVAITGTLAAAGSTWNDLLGALNATGTGLGEFGSFAMDPSIGQMKFTAASGFNVQLVSDSTTRGTTGVSLTSLEGMSSQATAGRAMEVGVDPEVAADPSRLAVGRPDLTVALGARVIEQGDNRGAAALSAAKDTIQNFAAAGSLGAQSTSITLYASRLGGEAGRMAADAQRDADGAQAVATAATDRRSQVEGVSLDDELLKMTTYQNAYAASARVIQAATEMFNVLLNIGIATPV